MIKIRCTNIELLQQCPTRYLLQSRGAYSAPSLAAKRGLEMHKILEVALLKGRDEALKYIEGLNNKLETYKEYFISGLDSVLSEYKKIEKLKILATEQKLSVMYDAETELIGRYDLLIDVYSQVILVDYKTSATRYTSDKIHSLYQLPFYAYQLLKKENLKVDNLLIMNIWGQKKAQIQLLLKPFTDKDISYVEALINWVKAFEDRGVFEKSYNTCSWCDCKIICKEVPTISILPRDEELIISLIKKGNTYLIK